MMRNPPHDWWQDADNAGDIVLPEQRAIAVYPNGKGCLVIRQEADWNDDEDSIILVQPQHAERVARALVNWAEQVLGHEQPAEQPETRRKRPLSNAERQRRFRNERNERVTKSNAGNACEVTPGNAQAPTMVPDFTELFEQDEENNQLAG